MRAWRWSPRQRAWRWSPRQRAWRWSPRQRALDRALALSALHDERLVAIPVEEHVHGVEPELDRHREVALDLFLEADGPDPFCVGLERLALVALGLVHPDPALDGLGHPLGRQPDLQARAVGDLALLVDAADVCHVGRDRVLADLDRRAVEPDVGDVVLAAAVGATGVLDVDPSRQRIGDLHLEQLLVDGRVEAHRARDAQLAAVGA